MLLRAVSAFALLALTACGQPPADKSAEAQQTPQESTKAPAAAPIEQPPPPPADPLAVGSQDARDDLYCAGVIFASNPSPDGALNPTDEAVLRRQQAWGIILAESGINKLVEQKAAHATHGALIADAYTDQAAKDLAAKKPRIKLEKCYDRAKAAPVVQ